MFPPSSQLGSPSGAPPARMRTRLPGWLLAIVLAGQLTRCPAVLAQPPAQLPKSHSVRPELFATGFEFAEGPAFDAAGNLYVVNYRGNGNIGRITPEGAASVLCKLDEIAPIAGRQSRANGLKVDAAGRIIAADFGGARLLRISPDGKQAEVLADRFQGQRFGGLNDVALDRAGNIYFTDPGQSTLENPSGGVYRYGINTKQVMQLDQELAYPNGLAVTPDQRQLCVGDSATRRILIYDLNPDGTVANRRALIEFPEETVGDIRGGPFSPDGMVFDAAGRLYVAMWTGGVINVVELPSGKLIRQYDAGGSKATNCHFHQGQLYTTIAAKEAVFRLPLRTPGFSYNLEK